MAELNQARDAEMMSDRLACCVPFCRRTKKKTREGREWICGTHWAAVSPTLRRRKSRVFRRYKSRFGNNPFWAYPAGSSQRIEAVKLDRICGKAWQVCKRQAIERAAGI